MVQISTLSTRTMLTKQNFEEVLRTYEIKQPRSVARQYIWNNFAELLPDDAELVPFFSRNNRNGVVLLKIDQDCVPYYFEISKKTKSTKPAICDLCRTQRNNAEVRLVYFSNKNNSPLRGLLVCADLACSANVRGLTQASITSQAQLNETQLDDSLNQIPLTNSSKIKRLRASLKQSLYN